MIGATWCAAALISTGAFVDSDRAVASNAPGEGSEWSMPAFGAAADSTRATATETGKAPGAQTTVEEVPPFVPTRVEVDPRLRFEAHLGLSLLEQASRLRLSSPMVGAGLSLRPGEHLRFDSAYLFTALKSGTEQLNVFNTFNQVRARLHYARPIGGAWLTIGGGPVAYLVTSSQSALGQQTDSTLIFTAGAALALGIETQVAEKLVRFELGAQSRGGRVDGLIGMTVGL